jgi:hypothetical protein
LIPAVGQTLGLAVGIAVFPVPVIAIILMLLSPKAGRNAGLFLAGWLLGLTAVGLLALVATVGAGGGIQVGDAARIMIGALFIFFAIRKWRARPGLGEQPRMPAWMSAADGFTGPRAFSVGLALAAVNPKNFGLTVAAMAQVASAGLDAGQEIASLLVFVVIASAGVLAPAIAYLVARERVEGSLDSARVWLVANNATVMTVIFLVLGAVILGDGLSGLG